MSASARAARTSGRVSIPTTTTQPIRKASAVVRPIRRQLKTKAKNSTTGRKTVHRSRETSAVMSGWRVANCWISHTLLVASRVGISQSTFWAVLAFSCTMEQAYSSCDRILENLRDERRKSRTLKQRIRVFFIGEKWPHTSPNAHDPFSINLNAGETLMNSQREEPAEKAFSRYKLVELCGTLRTNRTDTSELRALASTMGPSLLGSKLRLRLRNQRWKKHGGGGELTAGCWVDWEAGSRYRGSIIQVGSAEIRPDYFGQVSSCVTLKADPEKKFLSRTRLLEGLWEAKFMYSF